MNINTLRQEAREVLETERWTHHEMGDNIRKVIPVFEVNELCTKSHNGAVDFAQKYADTLIDRVVDAVEAAALEGCREMCDGDCNGYVGVQNAFKRFRGRREMTPEEADALEAEIRGV